MKYVDFFVVVLRVLAIEENRTWIPVWNHPGSPEIFSNLSSDWMGIESGVVLLNVHQNHFCVSTKPQMYTSNVLPS